MQLREAIAARRSIRKYFPQPVEPEKIEALIESARLCQSGHNRQPWRFMVLKGEQKARVTAIMREYYDALTPEQQAGMSSNVSTARVMDEAPVLILVFRIPCEEDDIVSDTVSIGAAIEHICLTATDLGLGALWIRQTRFTEKTIAARFGHPEMQMISALAVGYPAEAPAPRPRLGVQEIVLPAPEK